MAFSEIELKRIEGIVAPFCRRRSPDHARHQVRTEYRIKGHDVLIVELRAVWDDPTRWMEQGGCEDSIQSKRRVVAVVLAAGVAQVGDVPAVVDQSGSDSARRGN